MKKIFVPTVYFNRTNVWGGKVAREKLGTYYSREEAQAAIDEAKKNPDFKSSSIAVDWVS